MLHLNFQVSVLLDLTLLLIFLWVLTEVRPHLPARADQRNLNFQGTFSQRYPQTRAHCWCQLSPSYPSGLSLFSPLSGAPSQPYIGAPSGPFLPSQVFILCRRAKSGQNTCWSAHETSRGWGQWTLQADLPTVPETVQHQTSTLLSPSKTADIMTGT